MSLIHRPFATITGGPARLAQAGPGGFFYEEEFIGSPGAALPAPWNASESSPLGTTTMDYYANNAHMYEMSFDNQNEAQRVTLTWGDFRKLPERGRGASLFEWVFALELDSDPPGANFDLLLGVGSAYNATPDLVAQSAWIRVTGANKDILVETDDETTNYSADSGADIATNQLNSAIFDLSVLDDVRVYWAANISNPIAGPVGYTLIDSGIDMTANTTGGNALWQPYVQMTKQSGDQHVLLLDAFRYYADSRGY